MSQKEYECIFDRYDASVVATNKNGKIESMIDGSGAEVVELVLLIVKNMANSAGVDVEKVLDLLKEIHNMKDGKGTMN